MPKAMILKAITENTNDSSKPITDMKNYDLEISSMTLSPQLWPSDSELSELFQSASVTTTSCQKCAEEHRSEPVAVVHSECGTLTLCARPTTLLLCPRCRLMSRGKCEQEICDRCLKVVSNQRWTNSLMFIVLCHTILWSNAFILWFLKMPFSSYKSPKLSTSNIPGSLLKCSQKMFSLETTGFITWTQKQIEFQKREVM